MIDPPHDSSSSDSETQSLFDRAQICLQAHNLEEAGNAYAQVLARVPTHAPSLRGLGNIAVAMENYDASIELFYRSLVSDPDNHESYLDLANVLGKVGKHMEAARCYWQLLVQFPEYTDDGFVRLGCIVYGQSVTDDRMADCRLFLLSSTNAFAHKALADELSANGMSDSAISHYQKAIDIEPEYAKAHMSLADLYQSTGKFSPAVWHYNQSLKLEPTAAGYNNLGCVMHRQRNFDEARRYYSTALVWRPDYFDAFMNLGNLSMDLDECRQAVESYRSALSLSPKIAEGHLILGKAYHRLGELDQAIASFDRAIALRPSYSEAHVGKAESFLLKGDLISGWAEYEWRSKCKDYSLSAWSFKGPQWNGESLLGKRILVHCEQGYGDSVQFLRYLPLLQARGGEVVLGLPERLGGIDI